MPKTIRFILYLVLLTTVCQCNRNLQTPRHPILGSYSLRAHDNSGLLVFTGTIRLETIEENHLQGHCTIVKEKSAPDHVFDDNGKCEAPLEGRTISFDLAPSMDDGGMLLEGELDSGKITGVWKLDGFVTSDALGPFQAVRSN